MAVAGIHRIIAELGAFVPTAHEGVNEERLYQILDGFRTLVGRDPAIRSIFELIERFPDAELGSPGPLVHELEAVGGYESELRESLHRRPTALSLWMVNRILNSAVDASVRQSWLNELRASLEHPYATASARRQAEEFFAYQRASAV